MSATPGPGAQRAAEVSALQAALAAEHAAVYGYGVAGGRLTGRLLARAQRDWAEHQSARDALATMLTGLRATPAVAPVAYRFPVQARDPRTAAALAAYVEEQVATAYLGLVALTDPALRVLGARAVTAAALRGAAWRGRTVAFPGLTGTRLSQRESG